MDALPSFRQATCAIREHAVRCQNNDAVCVCSTGAIVNVASTSAFVAQPGFVPYSTSKGAVLQLTRCSALDLGAHGIR